MPRRPFLLLALFCLLCWLPGFFTLPPTDRDEARFAQASKQMLENGDYIRIRNGEVARNRKPIGIYWLQLPFAAAARAAGLATDNPIWPYRLPSLLGGLIAVWATFGLGRWLVGPRPALLGSMMLGASVILAVETGLAKTDAALLAATTLVMALLARAQLEPGGFGRRQAAGFWLALGAGVLIKGPVTPLVAGLATLWLLAADWRRRGWLRALRPGWGVPLLLAVVLPWFVAIGVATHGRFFAEAVGGDLGGKLAGGAEAHFGPPGLHLLLLPLTLFPASAAVLMALPAAWRLRRVPWVRFLVAWVVPAWLMFEAVPTKLPHYTLPLYPPLCLFAAHWLLDPARLPVARWWRGLSLTLFAAAALVIGLGAAALPAVVQPDAAHLWLGPPGLGAAALIAWLVLRGPRLERLAGPFGIAGPGRPRAMLAAVAAAPLLYWPVLEAELPHLPALWISPRVAAALAAHGPRSGFGTVGYAEPSLPFLAGTGTKLFGAPGEGAAYLAGAPGRVLLVEGRDRDAFLRAAAGAGFVPAPFATLRGFNYSRGRWLQLTLYGG